MSQRKPIIERGTSAYRNYLAYIVIGLSFLGLFLITLFYYLNNPTESSFEKIFSALVPLFATWVGTILAFYFGRENFESAANKYEAIINQLTPEILDDVLVRQMMISRKTMVSMPLADAEKKTVAELIAFLNSVDKSRLPILKGDEVECVIHKSTLLDAQNKNTTSTPIPYATFAKDFAGMIQSFLLVSEGDQLEKVRQQIKDQSKVKDVFVVDANQKVIGWITDTLILRYMKI